ncbi:MAG: cation diffusion facilitator family transporter [Candidatus Gracilibacteria bacterium]
MNTHALKEGEKLAKESAIQLLVLGCIKVFVGLLTGMTVVFADAINTLATVLGIFASYIGLKLSRRGADKHFEYGYHRIETFAAFLVSLGIVYLGYVMISKSIATIGESEAGSFRPFAITTTILVMIHSYRLSKTLKKVGEKTNSLSLIANSRNKKMELFAGVGVLISIIANYNNVPYIEGTVSIVISLIILKEGLSSTKESLFFLLDYWDDPILSHKIKKALRHEKDIVLRVNKVRLRRAGAFIFGEAFIDINPFAGIRDLREELEILEQKICSINPHIKDFAIFTHVSNVDKVLIAIPIKNKKDLNSEIASNLKETCAYLFVTLHDKKIGRHRIKALAESQKNLIELDEFLTKEKINILVDNKLSSLVYFNLRETHHVVIYPNFPDIKTVKQILELMLIDT